MGLLQFVLVSGAGELLVIAAVLLLSSGLVVLVRRRVGPPGPLAYPLIGNLLQLGLKAPTKALIQMSKKYGSVFTVHLGTKKVVVLTGYQTVKEALVKFDNVFGDRDPPKVFDDYNQGHGILWSNGDTWRELRRFTLNALKDLGMGRTAGEDKIVEESRHLVQLLQTFEGRPVCLARCLSPATANVICSFIYCSRFDYEDPDFRDLVDRVHMKNSLFGIIEIQLYNLFPTLFGWVADRRTLLRLAEAERQQNLSMFARLKATLDPQACRCFVDAFLAQKQQLERSGRTNAHFHDDNLMATVTNLFAAGTETTSTTLTWAFLFMAKYPQIQERAREELRSVVGGRQVQLEDRKLLHFTNAVIHETQRFANLIPTSLPHRTACDVVFRGHFIEKGTAVLPLLESVLFDEAQWERPRSFHPAHFLDEDGKFVRRDAFLPFSAGRRACLGESLARMELFIFFCTLLQRFRFTPPPGVSEDDLDLTPRSGLTFSPPTHCLCAVPLE